MRAKYKRTFHGYGPKPYNTMDLYDANDRRKYVVCGCCLARVGSLPTICRGCTFAVCYACTQYRGLEVGFCRECSRSGEL